MVGVKGHREYTDYAIPPGITLREVLDSMGITPGDFALRLGMARDVIDQIIDGQAPITLDVAERLESVLGVDSSFWLNLEVNYRIDLMRTKAIVKDNNLRNL